MPGQRDLRSAASHLVFIASTEAYLRFLVGITPIHMEIFKGFQAPEKTRNRPSAPHKRFRGHENGKAF
jgi:hypothetical protein